MCISLADRLAFRLTCLFGGVQRSFLCQRDVFDSLISRVMFPSTSYWGKPRWFGAPINFSASSTVSDACFCILDVQILVFFWSNKTAYRISFSDFRAPLKNWRSGTSISVPLACKASALPSELHPSWRSVIAISNLSLLMQQLNSVFYCLSL